MTGSACIYVDVEGEDEDGEDCKEDESVYHNCLSICLHAPKLHWPAVPR